MDGVVKQQEPSRLESLPGELRNRIYRHSVVEEKPVSAALVIDCDMKTWRSTKPPLAMANKKIRHEILSIYYAENAFVFGPVAGEWGRECEKRARAWICSTAKYSSLIKQVGASFYVTSNDGNHEESFETSILANVNRKDRLNNRLWTSD